MKKILAFAFLCILAAYSASIRNVSAAPYPITAHYSLKTPVIDGFLGSAEWNDTSRHLVNLTDGVNNVEAWIYFKNNGTHIFIGLLVEMVYSHAVDQFVIVFDEGDDGSHGSGTRDYMLTDNQEDVKSWSTSPVSHTDGFYANSTFWLLETEIDFVADGNRELDHATTPDEIEYSEGVYWLDDHWEVEFAIPFVGNDAGVSDISDLSSSITDIVGVKIQYYYGPGPNNFYFPAGDQYQIGTYANLYFSPLPTVESCDALGAKKDGFALGETVYVNGSGYLPSTTFDFYVVNDTEWTDGMPIPARMAGTLTAVTSDPSGNILPSAVWSTPSLIGQYDIVVDVNGNGFYEKQVDVLDNNDVQVTAGFIIPELSLAVLSLFMLASLLAAIAIKRKQVA